MREKFFISVSRRFHGSVIKQGTSNGKGVSSCKGAVTANINPPNQPVDNPKHEDDDEERAVRVKLQQKLAAFRKEQLSAGPELIMQWKEKVERH